LSNEKPLLQAVVFIQQSTIINQQFLKRRLHLQAFDHRGQRTLRCVALLLHFGDFFPQRLDAVFLLVEFADIALDQRFPSEMFVTVSGALDSVSEF
jgi:hypothetical protein